MAILVVGAGFAGTVLAERAAFAGKQVVVLDRRTHIAGNAYDHPDEHGVLVHRYGPHIFHTNAPHVADYLSRFTAWRDYEHRVLASVEGELYPIPINRITINRLYGMNLSEEEAAAYLDKVREPRDPIRTSEDVVLSSVGRDLCDKFFRNYTRKQWGMDLSELAALVAARIPTRSNDDDRYFTDSFQKMPRDGFTRMFQNMLDHPNIRVELGTDFKEVDRSHFEHIFYSGPIDEYFDHRFGKLPYRSLSFQHEHLQDQQQFQPVGTVNYPNDFAFTRITEFKHLTGQTHTGTSIVREYPQAEGDPYYPVPSEQNQQLYKQYQALADAETSTTFVGRLAQYRYLNMDQVVAQALVVAERHGLGSVREPEPAGSAA
ncbi:UDP-galactopyranose mutase [Terriglobus aquaticus]|uniref:UDP-galactopyranose mutase n=1 Tax=Terriglobus aquaticus TaxID=940139 RepID=A0ABW9KPW9_9BACT|nr:UDP-galactopyranose mutase [Terriglobus aquaticus]